MTKLKKEQCDEIFRLRREFGLHWSELGAMFGVDGSTANRAYQRTLKREAPKVDYQEALEAELDRLEQRERTALMWIAGATEKGKQIQSVDLLRIDAVLDRCAKRRAALTGLDAPKRIEIEGLSRDPLAAEMERALDELERLANAEA